MVRPEFGRRSDGGPVRTERVRLPNNRTMGRAATGFLFIPSRPDNGGRNGNPIPSGCWRMRWNGLAREVQWPLASACRGPDSSASRLAGQTPRGRQPREEAMASILSRVRPCHRNGAIGRFSALAAEPVLLRQPNLPLHMGWRKHRAGGVLFRRLLAE